MQSRVAAAPSGRGATRVQPRAQPRQNIATAPRPTARKLAARSPAPPVAPPPPSSPLAKHPRQRPSPPCSTSSATLLPSTSRLAQPAGSRAPWAAPPPPKLTSALQSALPLVAARVAQLAVAWVLTARILIVDPLAIEFDDFGAELDEQMAKLEASFSKLSTDMSALGAKVDAAIHLQAARSAELGQSLQLQLQLAV